MEKQAVHSVLKVSSLNKKFMNLQAVSNISFSLEQGDIFRILWAQRCRKNHHLRILLDIIKADSGRIEWNLNGKRGELPPAEHIGYLPEERGLYTDIPIIRSLVYLATIRGMNPAEAKTAAMDWLERLDLAGRAKEKLQALSKGNQQKIQFVASILHKPSFAILDEPFSGLDPLNQEKFIEYIREINQQGTTILLSAHQMSLVEKIAGKIFLINQGREVYNGSLSGIYDAFGKNHIIDLQFRSSVNESAFLNLPGVEQVNNPDECTVELTFSAGNRPEQGLVGAFCHRRHQQHKQS
ncbi:MAG: ATP-binding cassette domain-containing protein [Bacteroidales bacterium]|nr:ATP-binding cassette domain-containing protein [Bacteroidales bacterium]